MLNEIMKTIQGIKEELNKETADSQIKISWKLKTQDGKQKL